MVNIPGQPSAPPPTPNPLNDKRTNLTTQQSQSRSSSNNTTRQNSSGADSTPLSVLALLLKTGQYSDLTIKCGDQEFRVHKAVICPQSTFFAACTDGGFRESIEGVINLEEDDPDTVARMVSYMYTMDYSDIDPSVSEDDESAFKASQLRAHIFVYSIADKYNITALKEHAESHFSELLLPENLSKDTLLETAQTVYEHTPSTDRTLRDLITARLTLTFDLLAEDEAFRSLCQTNGDLCYDLLLAHKTHSATQRAMITAANTGYTKAEKLVETVISERQFCASRYCQGLRSQLRVRRTGSVVACNLGLELWCKMCGWHGVDPDSATSWHRQIGSSSGNGGNGQDSRN